VISPSSSKKTGSLHQSLKQPKPGNKYGPSTKVIGRLDYAALARGCAQRSPPKVIVTVPVSRRIRNPGIRLQAEALARQADCAVRSFKLAGSYKEYGSDNGAWRDYIYRPVPHGMNVPRRQSMRIAKS